MVIGKQSEPPPSTMTPLTAKWQHVLDPHTLCALPLPVSPEAFRLSSIAVALRKTVVHLQQIEGLRKSLGPWVKTRFVQYRELQKL